MGFPTIDLMRTGANIVRLRKAAGITVHDLQMVFGFNSPQAIYKWQNGAALPTVDNLIVLAALLHVRIDDILITDDAVASCLYTQIPESRINTELFNYHQKTE